MKNENKTTTTKRMKKLEKALKLANYNLKAVKKILGV